MWEKSKEKLKVVLINLHGDGNMTVAYLHSLIEKSGFQIKTIHFRRLIFNSVAPSKKEKATLKKVVDKLNPEVILISVNSMDFWDACEITKMFKNKIVVWGGVHPLIEPERCLKHVNIIVRGEGDEAIIDLLNAIKNKKCLDKIKNVWIKKEGEIIKNKFRPLVKDLDKLPIPDYTNKNKIYILGERIYTKNPMPFSKYYYNISFSRGCPFSCKYCINHFYNKTFKHKYFRKRSVDSVIKELILAKKIFPKLDFVNFWDDVFIADIISLSEFVKKYKKYINLPFFAYGNANFVNEKNMKLLKEAGLAFFDIGIQSGSEEIRIEAFGRTDTNENILKANKIIHKFKIPTGHDIIFSEFETEQDIETGIKFMLKLKKPFKVQENRLAYYPNFEITKIALKQGKIKTEQIASMNPKIRTQLFTKEEIEKKPSMNYYSFLGKRFIPNWFVRYILRNKWHKKNPKILFNVRVVVERLENFKSLLKSMFKWLLRGEFKYVYNRFFNRRDYL